MLLMRVFQKYKHTFKKISKRYYILYMKGHYYFYSLIVAVYSGDISNNFLWLS